jgi:hypothetical protein
MSQWEDQFKKHPVHTTLSHLRAIFDGNELVSEDVTVIGLVDKIRQASAYCESALENVIPAIINDAALRNINSYLQNILNEVNAYKWLFEGLSG